MDIWQTLILNGKKVRQDDPRHSPPKKGSELAVSPMPTSAVVTNGIAASPTAQRPASTRRHRRRGRWASWARYAMKTGGIVVGDGQSDAAGV